MSLLCFRRRSSSGFILLEVIISLVILGVSVATLMRSITISMAAIKRNDITNQAAVLAEQLMQDIELRTPTTKVTRGDFAEQGFPRYDYLLEYREEPIRYTRIRTTGKVSNLRPLRHATLRVYYEDGRMRRLEVLHLELYLPPIERFDYQSKFLNGLFREDM